VTVERRERHRQEPITIELFRAPTTVADAVPAAIVSPSPPKTAAFPVPNVTASAAQRQVAAGDA